MSRGPMCQVVPHYDGLIITGWEPERYVPAAAATTLTRGLVQASVMVICEVHDWCGRVPVDSDYRPPGYEPWPL
ncbi:hypothetical protein ACFXJ8_21995 [Nonomuraea sp. NPDC059194]|uniref:hypothetical protein n=1 Tax=Nonomuraea sp. NPDC059194 TaxID=3346764 RepID=UPI0036B87B06